MIVKKIDDMKVVVIQTQDIFYRVMEKAQMDEIPDETLEPEKSKKWDKVEKEVLANIISEELKKAKEEGYTRYAIGDWENARKVGIDLGLNGMYLIVFKP